MWELPVLGVVVLFAFAGVLQLSMGQMARFFDKQAPLPPTCSDQEDREEEQVAAVVAAVHRYRSR
ncbi:MAG: hypothetical protein HQL88_06995 [Magnetococcales bacterium]|nr:hypothetical protein [Magnetococcales bacterium]